MILTRLKEFADTQMSLPPEMYGEVRIRWMIELRNDGSLESVTPLGGTDKTDKNGIPYIAPTIVRAAGIKPKLLADNGEYVLNIPRDPRKAERVAESHRQFVELIKICAETTEEPSVKAVLAFLNSWDSDTTKLPGAFKPDDVLTFRVDGIIPAVEVRSVQEFWANYTAGGEDDNRPIMTCLVTGELGPVERRLPVKIKRIPDGQMAGTSLVSANAQPFTSYGLENSLTSPISRAAGERFAKALNHLIATKDSRVYVGPLVYVFWTREKTDFDFLSYIEEPNTKTVKHLFDSAQSGRQVHDAKANQFYALALSASGGRAVVRDWLETTIPEAEDNLRRWFSAQSIVDAYGQKGKPLGVRPLIYSAYRDASKEMTASVPAALMRMALKWSYLPIDLLTRAVNRNRAEGNVTRPRAALIKLVLTKQGVLMTEMESLNLAPDLPDSERVAYHCGRLLAELEAAQRAALGRVNATLTDRYYGSASSTPAKVFPVLLRSSRAHLSKLRKTKPSTHSAIDGRLQEIMVAIGTVLTPEANTDPAKRQEQIELMMTGMSLPNFPTSLDMPAQGLFALGYYHQRAADRAAAITAKEAAKKKEEKKKEITDARTAH